MRQLRLNLGALGVIRLRTEVEWNDHDLLRFLEKQGLLPAQRLCLECRIDPTMSKMWGGGAALVCNVVEVVP